MKTTSPLKRWVKIIGWTCAASGLSLALFLGYLWRQNARTIELPTPSGPYAVGRTSFDWVDKTRPERLRPGTEASRELMVFVWYPAEAVSRPAAEYLPAKWRQAREQTQGGLARFFLQHLDSVRVHALADAPLAALSPTYPVLIFEPGLGPIATDYTTLVEDLASHGYIVATCTPTYSAGVVVFPDGRVAYSTKEGNLPDTASMTDTQEILDRLIKVWADDDEFVLNQLEKLNLHDPAGRFSGRLDLQSIGVLGHSFGGSTAAEVCRLDSRFKAGIDIDGYPRGEVVQSGLPQPFMFIWGDHPVPADAEWSQAERNIQAIYGKLNKGGYQLTLHGAHHFNFTDNGLFYSPFHRWEHLLGTINGQRALKITTDYAAAFVDHYLNGAPEEFLNGPSPHDPEVAFESR